jgi:hypothetical protein
MKKFVQETVNKNTEQERLGLSGLALREASQELEVQIHE